MEVYLTKKTLNFCQSNLKSSKNLGILDAMWKMFIEHILGEYILLFITKILEKAREKRSIYLVNSIHKSISIQLSCYEESEVSILKHASKGNCTENQERKVKHR